LYCLNVREINNRTDSLSSHFLISLSVSSIFCVFALTKYTLRKIGKNVRRSGCNLYYWKWKVEAGMVSLVIKKRQRDAFDCPENIS